MGSWTQQALGGGWTSGALEDDEPPEVGVTLEGLDADAAAADQARFKPWSGPEQIPATNNASAGTAMWGTQADPNASLWETMAEGSGDGAYAAAGGMLSGAGVNPGQLLGDDVRNRLALAHERSPVWAGGGQMFGEGAIQAAVMPAALAARPIVGGAASGALSGLGNADTDDWESKLAALEEGAGGGAVAGGVMGVLGAGARKGIEWGADTAAPWLRDQGRFNRVASTGLYGGSMDRLAQNIPGGRQGVADLGQWMEDEAITGLTPGRVAQQAQGAVDKYGGQQRGFVDNLSARENPVTVPTQPIADDLYDFGAANARMSADTSKAIGSRAAGKANDILADSQPMMDVAPGQDAAMGGPGMDWPDALLQRQAFDDEINYTKLGGANEDAASEAVARRAAGGFRSGLVSSLEEQAPELAPEWQGIQQNLGNALKVAEPAASREMREKGNQPLSLPSLIGAAGGGATGMLAAAAVKSGGRSALASGERMAATGLEKLGGAAPNAEAFGSFAGRTSAQEVGRDSRGYMLPQAALELMRQPGALGKWEKEFFDAANSNDTHALSQLIVRLSHTDDEFAQTILPQLKQLTAEGF